MASLEEELEHLMDSEYPDDGTVPAEQPHKRLRGPHLFLCKTKSNHVH